MPFLRFGRLRVLSELGEPAPDPTECPTGAAYSAHTLSLVNLNPNPNPYPNPHPNPYPNPNPNPYPYPYPYP